MYSNNNLDSFDFSLRDMEGRVDESNSAINISDVIEVIQTDPAFGSMEGKRMRLPEGSSPVCVKILEQPASKALRFRYECEGRSAGSIPGVNSTPENKTFPKIKIMGYVGRAVIVVSCVTKDPPYKPHPHNLVGKEGCKKGVCTMEVSSDDMEVTFANLGIQCVKKKDIEDALKQREEIRVDPFRTGFSHRTQPSSIDLNSVRLCFQAFLEGPHKGKFTIALTPVVSEPIYDKKAMADLVICKMSHCSGSVAGGNEIILLCEKVAKEDITVRFYEEKDGQVVWEGLGEFTPTQVHKQVAIAFRTPKYKTLEIDQPVKVYIQLRRPSDNAISEPLPFQITPLDSDPAQLKRKRQKYSNDSHVVALQDNEQMRMQRNEASGLSVKREPADSSPNPYYTIFNQSGRNVYSRTPSPLEYTGNVPGMSGGNMFTQPGSSSYSGGSSLLQPLNVYNPVSPLMAQPITSPHHQSQLPSYQNLQPMDPTGAGSLMNMDAQQYSIGLSLEQFNVQDLQDQLGPFDTSNLSANLSANLTLNEAQPSENMTDSLTRIVLNEFNM